MTITMWLLLCIVLAIIAVGKKSSTSLLLFGWGIVIWRKTAENSETVELLSRGNQRSISLPGTLIVFHTPWPAKPSNEPGVTVICSWRDAGMLRQLLESQKKAFEEVRRFPWTTADFKIYGMQPSGETIVLNNCSAVLRNRIAGELEHISRHR